MMGVSSPPVVRLLFVLLSTPVVIFFAHAVLARLRPRASRQMVAVQAAVASALPLALLAWRVALRFLPKGEVAPAALYAIVSYCCLANTYFHLFNMSETARRIRILYEVYKAGSLSPAAFESLYKTTDIIGIRLKRLVAMKQLRQEGGMYMIDGKTLLAAARIVISWRRLLGLEAMSK